MCRTEVLRTAVAMSLLLLASACSREEPRTVVLDPRTGREPVQTTPAPAASAPPAPAPAPVEAAAPPQSVQPQRAGGDGASLLAARFGRWPEAHVLDTDRPLDAVLDTATDLVRVRPRGPQPPTTEDA